MESVESGIVADTRLIGLNLFVVLASRPVVVWRDQVPLILRDAVDQRKSLSGVFTLAPFVPSSMISARKELVSHGEIRIERDGALQQRDSGLNTALAQLR